MYSPRTLEIERLSWRVVVYYNVLRSVKQILSTLDAWADTDDGPSDELYDHTAHSRSPADQTVRLTLCTQLLL
jgi:guanine nucleotide-binding protein alpha-1 subunit